MELYNPCLSLQVTLRYKLHVASNIYIYIYIRTGHGRKLLLHILYLFSSLRLRYVGNSLGNGCLGYLFTSLRLRYVGNS